MTGRTDYYASPGTRGDFRITPGSGNGYGTILSNGSACADPNLQGGRAYKFDVGDTTYGIRGKLAFGHVSDINPATGVQFTVSPGSTVYNGQQLGWTKQFPYSTCYQVSTSAGVHWHVEMYQPTHYSCFINWAANATLTTANTLGRIGSETLTARTAC